MNKGFTLIELIVVIAITAMLSGIILFSITQYINIGKDSNVAGNLAVLIPAGEVFYNGNGNSFEGFCNPTNSSTGTVLKNALMQMPDNDAGPCQSDIVTSIGNPAGVCCSVNGTNDAWYACAKKFSDPNMAFCVDSRGYKDEIDIGLCDIDGIEQTGGNKWRCP